MKEKIIEFLWRLTSRKFWLSIVASLTAYNLAKVDAPIGLAIKSKTTAEIAISIVAKVIEVKNS